jgi:hypothetical protein
VRWVPVRPTPGTIGRGVVIFRSTSPGRVTAQRMTGRRDAVVAADLAEARLLTMRPHGRRCCMVLMSLECS